MAIKPENQFISGVNKYLPSTIYRCKMNNPYVGGIPDMWYSGNKADLWVEYKYLPKNPSRGIVKFPLSELQKHWLEQRNIEGRNVVIVIGCPAGGAIFLPTVYEVSFDTFNSLVKSRAELANWIKKQTEV